jgi:hypothetical protein
MDDESGAWLTYAEAGHRLNITPEAARARAKRLGWRRQLGNDGRALVWAALEARPAGDLPVTARSPAVRKPDSAADVQLIEALREHVETLKMQLSAAEARNGAQADELAAERAQTAKAIAAFASLAERLDMLAKTALRRRSWWRWLL